MGHAKNRPKPKEEPLPPPEKPVVVKERVHTRTLTRDRETLAKAVEELANNVKVALDEDAYNNGRYARRMRLENHIKTESGECEEFPIVMPIAASCWNDVHLVEIELRIIKAIKSHVSDLRHPWYRIRVMFDDFIDPLTKDYLDKLDQDESLTSVDSPPYTSPTVHSHDSPVASTSGLRPSSIKAKARKRARPLDSDDTGDDDIITLD